MTKDEIIEEAVKYIPAEEVIDFPDSGELFFMAVKKGEEKAQFIGYGLCISYDMDYETKPYGKWVYFNFLDLGVFPPETKSIKLQPPHIAKGKYSNPDRTAEIIITNMNFNVTGKESEKSEVKEPLKINKTQKGVCTFYEFPKDVWKE